MISVVVVNDETRVSGDVNSKPIVRKKDGTVIVSESSWKPFVFATRFVEGDDELLYEKKFEDSVSYSLKEDSIVDVASSISAEVFEQLPVGLQELYCKTVSEGSALALFDGEVSVYDLNRVAAAAAGQVVYTREDVVEALLRLNFTFSNRKVRVEKVGGSGTDSSYLRVVFYTLPYEGGVRKILSKKSNGQPYADRRGRNVPDYPPVLDTVEIPASFIPSFVAGDEEEMVVKVSNYYRFITMMDKECE